jgi:heat shock protein 5
LNDPIAAALACARGSDSKIIVYDLGGGTFDVSLLSVNKGVFTVLATAEDTHLGGNDFDNRVIDYLVKAYNEKAGYNKKTGYIGTDVSNNKSAMIKLKKAVELAKRTLSLQLSAMIEIENFENGNGFLETLTRDQFEELNLELFEKTMKCVEQVLKDAKVTKSEIDEV